MTDLAISSAILLNNPTSFTAESLEHFVIIAVLGELVVSLSSETGEDLGADGSPPALSPLVVLPLLPRRLAPR